MGTIIIIIIYVAQNLILILLYTVPSLFFFLDNYLNTDRYMISGDNVNNNYMLRLL